MTSTSVSARRRRGRPGYDLESLLKIAVAIFNEQGFDGTSMEDLSKALGITKSAIYHHVSSKDELLELALNRALDGLGEIVERTRQLQEPAVTRLEFLVRGSIAVLAAETPYVTLLLRVRGNTVVERRALGRRRQFDHFVAGIVEEAVSDGTVRPDIQPAVTARLLFGLVNSVSEWFQPQSKLNTERLADSICKIAFHGMLAKP